MDIVIRNETTPDFPRVFEVNRLAFGQDNESRLVEKIRAGESFVPELSLIALVGEEIVGHILFSRIKIIGETTRETLALAPMAVHPDFQNRGIGSRLIREGLERARKLGFRSVIVLGHKDYYPRFGLQRASRWGIRCPFEVPDEAYMALELQENALADAAGVVEYPAEFMEA